MRTAPGKEEQESPLLLRIRSSQSASEITNLRAPEKNQQAEEIFLGPETQGMDIRPAEICTLV